MESIDPNGPGETSCSKCGAKLAPNSRYCVVCYHPASRGDTGGLHNIAASQVGSANRPDPGFVFLPDKHEAILRRRARRKISAIAGAIVIVLSSAGWFLYQRGERDRQKQKVTAHREDMASNELRLIADGLERFKEDVGRYPTTEEGINGLRTRPFSTVPSAQSQLANWYGPYVDGDYEVDPWGNDYLYQATKGGQGFELSSPGPAGSADAAKFRITSGDE